MSTASSPRAGQVAVALAGIVLIVVPLIAAGVKVASFGWLMVMLVMYLAPIPLMLIGYVLQLVLAIRGFLRRDGYIRTAPNRARAVAAAWVTSLGALFTAFFVVDGGDQGWGSTFMVWFGLESDVAAGDVSSALSFIAGAAWVLGWVWLLVEWILAKQAARRA